MSTALDPRVIEGEIARIREREANPYLTGIKTNLFNLVIFRGSTGGPDPSAPALQFLLGKRPARIITLEASAGAETSVSVAGRCFPDKRNRGVCFEEISIRGDAPGIDPGTWSPLLIRDLPVFAWWLAPAEGIGALAGAADLVDKVIVDTQLSADPMAALGRMHWLREETHGVMVLADLSWRRSFPLRVQVARAFNPAGLRERLSRISGVTLRGAAAAEGTLFFLWLAARLGWSVRRRAAGLPAFVQAGGRDITALHDGGPALTAGFTADFSFDDGGPPVTLEGGPDGCGSGPAGRIAYHALDEGEALLEEVDGMKQDPLFLEILKKADAEVTTA